MYINKKWSKYFSDIKEKVKEQKNFFFVPNNFHSKVEQLLPTFSISDEQNSFKKKLIMYAANIIK